jgi:hypothetical protein
MLVWPDVRFSMLSSSRRYAVVASRSSRRHAVRLTQDIVFLTCDGVNVQAKETGLLDDHKKATGEDKLPSGAYPDMGEGRYSALLRYLSTHLLPQRITRYTYIRSLVVHLLVRARTHTHTHTHTHVLARIPMQLQGLVLLQQLPARAFELRRVFDARAHLDADLRFVLPPRHCLLG